MLPLLNCVVYIVLLVILLLKINKNNKNKVKILGIFLAASFFWGLSEFFLSTSPAAHSGYFSLWNNLVVTATILSFVSLYHFIRVYINLPAGILTYCGYACVLIILALPFGGNLGNDAWLTGNALYTDAHLRASIIAAIAAPLALLTLMMLLKQYRALNDRVERNRISYLVMGTGVAAIYTLGAYNLSAPYSLAINNAGVLMNALIVFLVVRECRLPNLSFIFRRILAYGILAVVIFGIYSGVLYLGIRYAPFMPLYATLIIMSCLSVLLYILIRWLRPITEEKIDRFFHPASYTYRQVLGDFSSKITNIIDLDEVANEMLSTLGKTLRLKHLELLLRYDSDFVTQYTYPHSIGDTSDLLRLTQDSAITLWLEKEEKPLKTADMLNMSELKQALTEENTGLPDTEFAWLLPIKGREKMVSILALGNEQDGGVLHPENIEFAANIARQAGIVLENALLYTQARQKANIDELTRCYNHRHFHERLLEEISRASRFGDVFSLLIIDLDCFKSYNDIHGHLLGDNILKKVGEIIRNKIRAIDIAARYGGDEFTVILPKTSIDTAMRIAHRLQDAMGSEFVIEGMPITCSIGVASWPTDGIMKEDLIHAADSALYQAKKTGRNRVVTASKLVTLTISDKPTTPEDNSLILDTIYALAATVDAKDHYTFGHSKKVSKHACDIAIELGCSEEKVEEIRIAGLLHDIGKIGVSDEILRKNSNLNDDEWKPIHSHPAMGASILRHIDSLKECLPGVLYHHERYDGTGYPQGLKAENIPLDARILAVADSYDAMISNRPYHNRSWTTGRAIEELIRCSGTQFDPKVVKAFIRILHKEPRKYKGFVHTHQNV